MSLQFNSSFYLAQYPDIAEAGIDPQFHFENYGAVEGRAPNATLLPVAQGFDEQAYRDANPDVAAAVEAGQLESGYQHWVLYGRFEESRPEATFNGGTPVSEAAPASIDALFNAEEYLELNPDVAAAGIDAYEHFVNYGSAEGRAPNAAYAEVAANFDGQAYRDANPDIDAAIAGGADFTPYQHWVLYGQFEASRPEATLTDGRTVSDVLDGEEDVVTPTFTLAEALEAEELPAEYSIDAETVFAAEGVTVEAAAATFANVQAILEGAANAEDLVLADLFTWTVADTLENLEAADAAVLEGAASYTLTNEAGALGILTDEQAALVEGAENTADYSFTAVGETFTLAETTDAVAAVDGEASVYELTGIASATYGNAASLTVTLPGEEEPLVIDLRDATFSSGASLATALNGLDAFTEAGLEAEYVNNNALRITDANGRELGLSLQDAGAELEPSSSSVKLLASQLVSTDTVTLTIAGEEVILRGIEGENGAAVATSIQAALQAVEDAEGEKPYADMEASWDSATTTLTIKDSELRELGEATLLNQAESSSVAVTVAEDDVSDVAQLEVTIDGVTETVAVPKTALGSINRSGLESNLQEAFGIDSLAATATTANGVVTVTVTDSEGRPFAAEGTRLLNAGDGAVASITRLAPLSDAVVKDELGQLSITVGEQVVELANVNVSSMAALAKYITDAFDADVTAKVEGNAIVITDAAGRGISDVYAGEAITAQQGSTATVSGLSDTLAGSVDTITFNVGSTEVEVDASDASDLAELEDAINAAINDEGIADVSAEVNGQDLIITDARGREISDLSLANTSSDIPSSATLQGLSAEVVELDLGYFKVEYTNKDGESKEVVIEGDQFAAELPLTAAQVSEASPATPLKVTIGGETAEFESGTDGATATIGTVTYTLNVPSEGNVSIVADEGFTVSGIEAGFLAEETRTLVNERVAVEVFALKESETVEANDYVIKSASDVARLPVSFEGDDGDVNAEDFSTNAVNLNLATLIESGADIYGMVMSRNDLNIGGAEEGVASVAEKIASITLSTGATDYNSLFANKEFLTVEIEFTDGGTLSLKDLIATDFVDPAFGQTVAEELNGVLAELGITENFTQNADGAWVAAEGGINIGRTDLDDNEEIQNATLEELLGSLLSNLETQAADHTTETADLTLGPVVKSAGFGVELPANLIDDLDDAAENDTITLTVDAADVVFTLNADGEWNNDNYTLTVQEDGRLQVRSSDADIAFTVTGIASSIEARTEVAADVEAASQGFTGGLEALKTALEAKLAETDGFTVEIFENGTLAIYNSNVDVTIDAVEALTSEDGIELAVAQITDAIEREEGDESPIAIGDAAVIENSEVAGNQPLVGVNTTVSQAGSEEGINAVEVGNAAAATDAETAEVSFQAKSTDAGVEEGAGAGTVGEFEQTVEGVEAVEASAWTATFAIDFEAELEEAYTFTLTLDEVLGEDAANDAEIGMFEANVFAQVGMTAEDVRDAMLELINESELNEAFAASVNEEGQLVVEAAEMGVNYEAATAVALAGVEEPQIVEAA